MPAAPRRPVALLVALLSAVLVGLTTGLPYAVAPASAGGAAVPAADGSDPQALRQPDLVRTGRTPDGWSTYRLVAGGALSPARPGEGFRGEVRFTSGGRERAVRLLVPPAAREPAAVVVALHGLYQTAAGAERMQRWGAVVRAHGAVLVHGVGTSASWNAGTCCGRAAAGGVDDIGYLDDVLAMAAALHPLDPRRTHLAGFSNGAMMAYAYACARRERVAGVLAVAGTVTSRCRGRSDVAVLHVHGRDDRMVPLAGLAWSRPLATGLRPVSQTAGVFGPTITARVLPGHGHGWPTAAQGFDTTWQGWTFLAAHPRRG